MLPPQKPGPKTFISQPKMEPFAAPKSPFLDPNWSLGVQPPPSPPPKKTHRGRSPTSPLFAPFSAAPNPHRLHFLPFPHFSPFSPHFSLFPPFSPFSPFPLPPFLLFPSFLPPPPFFNPFLIIFSQFYLIFFPFFPRCFAPFTRQFPLAGPAHSGAEPRS